MLLGRCHQWIEQACTPWAEKKWKGTKSTDVAKSWKYLDNRNGGGWYGRDLTTPIHPPTTLTAFAIQKQPLETGKITLIILKISVCQRYSEPQLIACYRCVLFFQLSCMAAAPTWVPAQFNKLEHPYSHFCMDSRGRPSNHNSRAVSITAPLILRFVP